MTSVGEVFALIRELRVTTRAELAARTSLSRTAVTARVAALLELGLIEEAERAPSTGGRPATTLSFDADAGIVLCVAIGISRTRMAVCNLAGEIVATADIDQEVALGPDDLLPDVVKRLDVLLAGQPDVPVYGIGVSLPGPVDRERGCSRDSPILRGWDGVRLRPYFEELPKAPVLLDNDANAIALGERGGELERIDDLLVLKVSTGLGAGIIAGGALQRGASQAAGEFGHNKTPAAAGLSCRCGDTGCLEAIAAGWAVVHTLQQRGYSVRHMRDVVELAHAGDPEARRMIRDSGRHIGEVVAAAVNLLNPKVLVIAGDLAGAYEMFVAGLRETLYRNATAMSTRELEVVPAAHGGHSAVVGTATMVLEEVLSPRAVDDLVALG
ncbi:ROK family transcriptional regulator [Mycobacterium sp. ITM-2016-00317]|uniref:ROK family transcriptional regulator n=1 Tax=Mycobacterium sp. ITM-2016-00317 TaxID=2099694 RepID=UPI000D491D5B|nr:ROK family transcriptional regulator [Mycobacterium sp. ITM-2016-00317]WNG87622.1 ROK family transcriptional regulator [Mycobacterium sp. ITM-2016-00317]